MTRGVTGRFRARSSCGCAVSILTCAGGAARRSEAVPAARLDGRRGVVPVSRRRAARDWHVIAPDWRGFGCREWIRGRLLVRRLHRRPRCAARPLRAGRAGATRRPQPRRQHRDALRRRPAATRRARRVARGLRHSRRGTGQRARQVRRDGSTRSTIRQASALRTSTRSPTGCRRTTRGCRATRPHSSPRHWAKAQPDGTRDSPPIRGTSCRFRRSTGWKRCSRSGAALARRCCGSPPTESYIPKWLDAHPEGEAATDCSPASAAAGARAARRRWSRSRDAGHMLHHDQPRGGRARRSSRSLAWRDASPFGIASKRAAYGALVVLTLIWGINWMVMKFGAAARASGRLQHRAHVGRHRRAVRGARVAAAPALARIVDGRHRHRLLPDDDQLRRDDDGARRRRRGPHGGARLHDAVLDAAARLAGAGRARARQPVGGDRASRSRASCWSSSRGTGRASSRPSCGRCSRDSAGPPARSRRSISSASIASTCSTSSRGRCSSACCRSPCCRCSSPLPATQWSVSTSLPAVHGRDRDRRRLPAVDRGAALAAGGHGIAQHVRDSGDRAASRR